MMNQSRSRKMSAAGELGRSRLSKNSGDVTKSMTRDGTKDSKEHFKPQQQHSKTRIPKDIRYDLENALVGLCDVWFEEIKPYLLRNNVKLHVQCEGGDEAAAGGDRGPIPHASPGRHPSSQVSPGCHPCSHVDPGAATDLPRPRDASSAGCCSAPPAASTTRSRRPPQQPSKLPAKRQRLLTSLSENRRNSDEHVVQKPKRHARHPATVASSIDDASAIVHLRRYNNRAVPFTLTYTSKPSYDPGDSSPSTREVFTPRDVPYTKDQCTQTVKRLLRCKLQKRVKSPEKRNEIRTVRNKRQESPSPRQWKSMALHRSPASTVEPKSSAYPSPTYRQARANSSSPLRRRPHATFTSPSRARNKFSPVRSKPTWSQAKIEEFYLDAQDFQDEYDAALLWATANDTYFMHEVLKDKISLANSKSFRKTTPKTATSFLDVGKIKPPWK